MELNEIRKLIEEKDIKSILVSTPDVNGNFRGRAVSTEHFLDVICKHGLGICDCIYIMDTLDHEHRATCKLPWYPNWDVGMRDYVIKPDLSTFGVVPWLDRTAMVIGDVIDQETGNLLKTAPRSLLKKLIERANNLQYEIIAALELEFYVFPESINDIAAKGFRNIRTLAPAKHDYNIYRLAIHHEFLSNIVENMNLRGIPIYAYQMEEGNGQFECQIHHSDVLQAADKACIYKSGVKEMVARQGWTASFIAKYDENSPGNSCHVHQSVLKKGTKHNLFWDPNQEYKISKLMLNYIGGLQTVIKEFTLMWAPFVNSYKRYTTESYAGINASWGIDNRSVGIRILSEHESNCRLEHRIPGADSNPYLIMAAMLAGGLYGIEKNIQPSEICIGNAYEIPDSSCKRVPKNLGEAINSFRNSSLAREYFGNDFVEYYSEFKLSEWNEFCSHVTDWERKKYLEMA